MGDYNTPYQVIESAENYQVSVEVPSAVVEASLMAAGPSVPSAASTVPSNSPCIVEEVPVAKKKYYYSRTTLQFHRMAAYTGSEVG